jgi:hypothetical protein
MANNNGRFNIYGVNSLLFQIISHMSESERRKLKAVLISKAKDGKDLSSMITSLSEAKRYKLLEKLTNWHISKYSELSGYCEYDELRGYPRKSLSIPVELSKNGFTFLCLTQNMSNSGVYIQTDFSFQINQKITMILTPPKIAKDITIGGKIVRVDPKGIGVKFSKPIPNFPRIFS